MKRGKNGTDLLTLNNARSLARLADAVRILSSALGGSATLSRALMFVNVAKYGNSDGDIDQHALARSVRASAVTTSRNVAILSDSGNRGSKGLNLIRVQFDIVDRRRRVLRLSTKGVQVLRRILGAFVGRH